MAIPRRFAAAKLLGGADRGRAAPLEARPATARVRPVPTAAGWGAQSLLLTPAPRIGRPRELSANASLRPVPGSPTFAAPAGAPGQGRELRMRRGRLTREFRFLPHAAQDAKCQGGPLPSHENSAKRCITSGAATLCPASGRLGGPARVSISARAGLQSSSVGRVGLVPPERQFAAVAPRAIELSFSIIHALRDRFRASPCG
jgi:hypothetical protein